MAMTAEVLEMPCAREENEERGMWFEFVFDHNPEYADSFRAQVRCVDVHLFDESGTFVESLHAEGGELHDGHRIFLGGDLLHGSYKALTVGGMSEWFTFCDVNGEAPVAGVTTIRQVKLAPVHSGITAHEFPDLWFGRVFDFTYRPDANVRRVYLIRQTNRFNIILLHSDAEIHAPAYPIVMEIAAPEAGVYDYRNRPLVRKTAIYRPYYESVVTDNPVRGGAMTARINTMRLLTSERKGYSLVVRNEITGAILRRYDLLALLANSKPENRHDGTPLPLDEYLDREGVWNIVIIHGGGVNDSFIATRIIVNDRTVWENDVNV